MRYSIVYRYILKELTLTFFLSLGFLNLILMMNKLFVLSKKFLEVGVSFGDFVKFAIILQPKLMIFTIPVAFLFSILITYGRLAMDNEIIILKASGMSFINIVKPVFTLALFCFFCGLYITTYLGPYSLVKIKSEITNTISKRLPMSIKENIFNTFFKDIVIIPQQKNSFNTFSGVFIYDERKKDPFVTWAREASIYSSEDGRSIDIDMKDGAIRFFREESITELSFKRYVLLLLIDVSGKKKNYQEVSFGELLRIVKTSSETTALLELHRRFSMPAVSLFFMLLGPALLPLVGTMGRVGGISASIVICGFYYLISISLHNLTAAGRIHHLIGGWGATFLLGSISIIAFYKTSKQ